MVGYGHNETPEVIHLREFEFGSGTGNWDVGKVVIPLNIMFSRLKSGLGLGY